jgi:mono/diheme cytochrome c family protein
MSRLRRSRACHRSNRRRLSTSLVVLVVFGTAALAALAAGCGRGSREDELTHGKEVYTQECSRCHMVDGSGVEGVYPNLDRNPIVDLDSPEPTIDIVLRGREGMPAFAGQIPDQEIAAVITYIRQAWSNHASSVSPSQVK